MYRTIHSACSIPGVVMPIPLKAGLSTVLHHGFNKGQEKVATGIFLGGSLLVSWDRGR